jgi:L-alanine-DL-glutamate epimerase-like enolase superfamily enzyme
VRYCTPGTSTGPREEPHLPQCFEFRNGKVWPNARPGLGVEFDSKRLQMIAEITRVGENAR